MNKISSTLLALCLSSAVGLAFAAESMDKNGAMEKSTMSKDAMSMDAMKKDSVTKDGAMMKAPPKKMEKPHDKMEPSGGMAMEPKK